MNMASRPPAPTLCLRLLLFATCACSTAAAADKSFLQCFLSYSRNKTKNAPNLYIPNTNSYDTTLLSSVHNVWFLSSGAKKPSYIAVPKDAPDVQAAVSCGRQFGLRIRVRSGGHDYEGWSYVSSGDAFVLLDLANLRSVAVDTAQNTAWVGAGATVGEVYYNIGTKSATLAFPAGLCTTVGVGGQFSGGGIGTLLRKYGTSADNIVDAQVVDANGKLLNRASMGEDLFWAIRGGGAANFGVLVSYKLRLVPVPATVTVFAVTKNLGQGATQLLQKWQSVSPKFDDNLFMRTIAQAINDGSSPGGRSVQVVFQGMFLGRRDALISTLQQSFPELGVQAKDCNEVSWVQSTVFFAGISNVTALLDRSPNLVTSFKAKSGFVRTPISANDWSGIWKFLMDSKNEPLVMIMDPWGGMMDRTPENAIAFPHRKGNLFNIQYYLWWLGTDASVAQGHLEWMRRFHAFMAPYVSSNPRAAYLNYKDKDLGTNQVPGKSNYTQAAAWGRDYFLNNFEKLAIVKAKVDPQNYFWSEQSIPPFSALVSVM